MDVRMPDGTVIQGVPDNITQEELLKRYRQFADLPNPSERDKLLNNPLMRLARGGKDAFDAIAQVASRAAEVAPLPFAQPGNPTRIMDLAKGVSGVLGLPDPTSKGVDAAIAEGEEEYRSSRKAFGKQDDWDGFRLTGNVLSPANVILGRAATAMGPATNTVKDLAVSGAKAGALGSLFVPANNPDNFLQEKAAQAGVGAVAGGVMGPVVGRAVEYAAPRAMKLWQSMRGTGKQSPDAAMSEAIERVLADMEMGLKDLPNDVREQIRAQVQVAMSSGKVDPAAAARRADFEGLGMKGMLGQYTRDPRQFATEQNIRSQSPEITGLLQEQNRRLRELVGGLGSQAKTPFAAGEQIIGALQGADDKMSGRVSEAYQAARASAGKDVELPLQGLAQDYAQVLRDFGDKIPSGVRNNLDDLGLLTGRQNRLYTVEEAERLLKVINKNASSDPAVNESLRQLREAIKRSVTEATGDGGVFEGARKLAAARFSTLEKTPALQAAIGDVEPDKFVSKFILNGNVRQVRSMVDVLKKESPEAYEQARQQIGAYLERAAFGDDLAGDKGFLAQSFAKKLREIGNEKLSTFYTPQEVRALYQIARVAQYINSPPAAAAVNYSNNAAWALPVLERIPGLGSVAAMLRGLIGPARAGLQARKALTANLPPPPPQPLPAVSPELERYLMSAPPAVLGGLLSGAVVAP